MTNEFLDYVEDILVAMEKAEAFVEGMSYRQFLEDDRTFFAVTRAIEIIGEATKRLPRTFRERYAHIPWKDMAGMRDHLIHGYDQVNLEIVWTVVKNEIPQVKPLIQQILRDFEDSG